MLGVSPAASKAQIAKAYKKLAARYHPDLHEDNALKDLAREKMDQLNQAYEVLSDPAKRADYDRQMAFDPARGQRTTRPPSPLPRFLLLLALVLAAILLLRLFPNPRASSVIAIALAIIWFGPRILRYLFPKKR